MARVPRAPAPPPPPRRHSDPTTQNKTNTIQKKHRRFSEIRNTKPEVDLRQELLQLNLSSRDVDKWLGNKFDEKEEEYEVDFRFEHDIPLQRTISLDRGIEIFNYLQTLSDTSDTSSNVTDSFWTIGSEEEGIRAEQYRSFEDIPASPIKAKSRHISLDVTNTISGSNTAFAVLKESYKGIETESGRVTPQIRKLQKTYSFKNFDEYKELAKSSTENLARVETDIDLEGIEMKQVVPVYRSISYELGNQNVIDKRATRQRRYGVTSNVWQEKTEIDRLMKPNSIHFKSSDDVFIKSVEKNSCPGSFEAIDKCLKVKFLEDKRVKYPSDALNSVRKLKRDLNVPSNSGNTELIVPRIIVTEVDAFNALDIEKGSTFEDTSNLVEIDRNCDCSICSGSDGEQKSSFLSRNLNKIFMRLVSYKEYSKRLGFWDESKLNENEMYNCFIQLLKLLLGLWLRHFDHKQHNLCA